MTNSNFRAEAPSVFNRLGPSACITDPAYKVCPEGMSCQQRG